MWKRSDQVSLLACLQGQKGKLRRGCQYAPAEFLYMINLHVIKEQQLSYASVILYLINSYMPYFFMLFSYINGTINCK